MIPGWRGMAVLAGIAGLTGVILAAMGSHFEGGLDDLADQRAWQIANMIQLLHAASLLAMSSLCHNRPSKLLGAAGLLMATGILLFSGSLYVGVFIEPGDSLGVAPLGGMVLMGSWLLLIIAVLRRNSTAAS